MQIRRIPVNFEDLELAFEDASDFGQYYFDRETGAVIVITDDIRYELDAIDRECQDAPGPEDDVFAEALQQRNLPDWMREVVLQAYAVEQDDGSRYIAVPTADSHESYRTMEDFIETVSDRRLQARLLHAIQGRGAFRRFKDVLLAYPHERERWFAFKSARIREQVVRWLQVEGITPILEEE